MILKKYYELFGSDIDEPDRNDDRKQIVSEILYSLELLDDLINDVNDLRKLKEFEKILKKYK